MTLPNLNDILLACAEMKWKEHPAAMAEHLTKERGDAKFLRPRHVDYISRVLARASTTPNSRIMIFAPPRHGKSHLCSLFFAVWYLTVYSANRFIMCGYGDEFASEWGGKVRDTMDEFKNVLGVGPSKKNKAADHWTTTRGGTMYTAGVGGALTGRGTNMLVVDDALKSAEEADSQTIRDKIFQWFTQTAFTRLEPGGSVVIINTRWHFDDLCGRLLKEQPGEWEVISFPALAEEEDALGRKVGEPLWADRFPTQALEQIKKTVGSRGWASLYQQRPALEEGAMFRKEWFSYYVDHEDFFELKYADRTERVMKDQCWCFITADLALTMKTHSDYSVAQVWFIERTKDGKGGRMFLHDLWRVQLEGPGVEAELRKMVTKWNPLFIGLEDAHYGKHLVQTFRRDGLPVRALKASKDKVTRAQPLALRLENGRVFFRRGAPWLTDFEDEMSQFPLGRHDDQCDAAAHAVGFADSRDMWIAPPKPELPANSLGKILGMDKVFGPPKPKPLFKYAKEKK